jgi:hypothetical protein
LGDVVEIAGFIGGNRRCKEKNCSQDVVPQAYIVFEGAFSDGSERASDDLRLSPEKSDLEKTGFADIDEVRAIGKIP